MLETLRQRRYLGLFAASLVVALVCIAAGTWQIARFHQKHDANSELRTNNRRPVTDISAALGPASMAPPVGRNAQYRHVSASGTFLTSYETMVRGQTVNGDVGYLVLTPFRTGSGVLLVVRGFVSQTQRATLTPKVPSPPSGNLSITGRLEPADVKADRFGALPGNQVESVNAADQSERLGQPVWDGYAELVAGQPGTAGLEAIPEPDMSNPAGGAEEPQHAAYVVQWYMFAGLALALPFVLAGAERKRGQDPQPESEAATSSQPGSTPQSASATTRQSSRRARRAQLDDRLAGRS